MSSPSHLDPNSAVLKVLPLGFPWHTLDPFLFCVHHLDHYPQGTAQLGPAPALLRGRALGQDFAGIDGWNMYHGEVVPGFPAHPHRGFETVTLARQGFIDHSDSLGAAARFGQGDVQWMTAGKGVVHSEMFPLLNRQGPNTAELFQIWLNLPRRAKTAPAHFEMFWSEDVPVVQAMDAQGRATHITLVAGALGEHRPPQPPPDSWAADPGSRVAIWTVRLEPGASWTVPADAPGLNRALYVFDSGGLDVSGHVAQAGQALVVRSEVELRLHDAGQGTELLMLQGRPIGEPVAQHGPFVMNSPQEIQQAFLEYQRTRFGGWPWGPADPVHAAERGRFARYPDGRVEQK